MSIVMPAGSDWSRACNIRQGQSPEYYTNDDNYEPFTNTGGWDGRDASWGLRSYWEGTNSGQPQSWAKKFVSPFDTAVILTKMSFYSCAGHSNGKTFAGNTSGGQVGPVGGYGCTYRCDVYVKGGGYIRNAASVPVNSIGHFNCYYGGYGNVCKTRNDTSFGDITLFGPGSPYAGRGLERQKREFVFDDQNNVEIPPHGEAYVVVTPTSWASGSNAYNSLLLIQSYSPFFTTEFKPSSFPYIWRMSEDHTWKLEANIWQYTGKEWIEHKN